MNELIQKDIVEDQDVKKLSEDEIKKIQKLRSMHDVEVCIDQDAGHVTIRGHPDDVTSVRKKVYEMLKNIMAREKKGKN